MNKDNPFFDNDENDVERTIIRPTPGGGSPEREPVPSRKQPEPPNARPGHYSVEQGLNPLVTAAAPLLSLIYKLKTSPAHNDIDGLRQQVEQEISTFETRATPGTDKETVYAARYCLCCVIDESVLNTPWGNRSNWSNHSLLIHFHQESSGGEKFFVILERLMKDPGHHIEILELMYLCLSMGFEGKYQVQEAGQRALEQIRESLYQLIRNQRGEFRRELSPHWQGENTVHDGLRSYLPVWVIALVTCAILLITYLGFSYFINQASSPIFQQLYTIGREEPPALVLKAATPAPKPEISLFDRISAFLDTEISQGDLEVIDSETSVTIRLRNQGLFRSGMATIKPEVQPLIERLADTLSIVEGKIIIAGHSDNIPIHTLRFPSNWHLSKARADSVTAFIQQLSIVPRSITSEGRADNEPLVANDSPKNRALNRRVEIILEK